MATRTRLVLGIFTLVMGVVMLALAEREAEDACRRCADPDGPPQFHSTHTSLALFVSSSFLLFVSTLCWWAIGKALPC